MKFLSIIFALLFFSIISFSVQAEQDNKSFHGIWFGQGQTWDDGGGNSECQVQFNIEQSKDFINIIEGDFRCPLGRMSWDSIQIDIKGYDLYVFNKHVGTLNDKKILIESEHPYENDVQWKFSAQIIDNTLYVHEERKTEQIIIYNDAVLTKGRP